MLGAAPGGVPQELARSTKHPRTSFATIVLIPAAEEKQMDLINNLTVIEQIRIRIKFMSMKSKEFQNMQSVSN